MKPFTLSLLLGLTGCVSTHDSPNNAHLIQVAPTESPKPRISKETAIEIARNYAEKKYPYIDFSQKLATANPAQDQNSWLVHLGGLPKKGVHSSPNIRICGSYATNVVVCLDGAISKNSSYCTLSGW